MLDQLYYPDKKAYTITQCYRETQGLGKQYFVWNDIVYELCHELRRGYRKYLDLDTFLSCHSDIDLVEEAYKILGSYPNNGEESV